MIWHWVPPRHWKKQSKQGRQIPSVRFILYSISQDLNIFHSASVLHLRQLDSSCCCLKYSQSMTWLTKKAFGMHWGNRQGHCVISISQKRVDQPCVALPFSSTNGSVFICVCIQRSGLPLKLSRKVIDFIGFFRKEKKMDGKEKYFEYCISAFKKLWLCIRYLHDRTRGESVDLLKLLFNILWG